MCEKHQNLTTLFKSKLTNDFSDSTFTAPKEYSHITTPN